MTRSKKGGATAPIPADDYPPFPGFDAAGFSFLRDIAKNNTREWLTEDRKAIYRDHLLEPMKCLMSELRRTFAEEEIPFSPDPERGLFRIYRDTRFSKDKRPFKTHIGAAVPFGNEGREGVGNYLHIQPGECFFGGGAYFIDSTGLKRLRHAIDADQAELRKIIKRVEADFGPLQGERLKRAPAGFTEDHTALDLLRYKQMYVTATFPDELAESRELVDWIVMKTKESLDFNRYLYETIKGIRL